MRTHIDDLPKLQKKLHEWKKESHMGMRVNKRWRSIQLIHKSNSNGKDVKAFCLKTSLLIRGSLFFLHVIDTNAWY